MITKKFHSEPSPPDLVLEVRGETRYRGVPKGRLEFASERYGTLQLTQVIGSFLNGLDVDRALLHGPQPVRVARNGHALLHLVVSQDPDEVALVGQGLAFDPSTTSIGRVLEELGL